MRGEETTDRIHALTRISVDEGKWILQITEVYYLVSYLPIKTLFLGSTDLVFEIPNFIADEDSPMDPVGSRFESWWAHILDLRFTLTFDSFRSLSPQSVTLLPHIYPCLSTR